MTSDARALFEQARVARLATVTPQGRPHLVPIVFAVNRSRIVTAVDAKPKRSTALQRLANIAANPSVSVLVDHYAEDWTQLWWARADGIATVVDADAAGSALEVLAAKYEQYQRTRPPGPVIVVDVERWTSWSSSG